MALDVQKVSRLYQKLLAEISKVIIGKEETKQALVVALLAGGHILVEGLPGTAKTSLAKAFARAIGGDFKRIQFTPDMMPADITGFYMYSQAQPAKFIQGPIFANIVLADELNRTTPRTQSALLQAMAERQVTIERETYSLPDPFIVVATQVYSGGEGTYPLTDVQIDRFLLRVVSGYASKDEEKQILANIDNIDEPDIKAVTTLEEIRELHEAAKSVYVSPDILEYITSIVACLRADADIFSGPSTRAAIALYRASRVMAMLDERSFVIPDDVKAMIFPAIEHRIKVKPESEMDDITPRAVLQRVVNQVAVPKPEL